MTSIQPPPTKANFKVLHEEMHGNMTARSDVQGYQEPDEQAMKYDEEECQDDSGDERQQEEGSDTSEDSQMHVEPNVAADIEKFRDTFQGISQRFRLINRIGEGTFSTVYKAEDLEYEQYRNDYWDPDESEPSRRASPAATKTRAPRRRPKYVAIKKIYVTSSPMRILNELDLLKDLRGCDSVCPIITAFRHHDQVVAVLPYFRHTDFRDYFRDMTVADVRIYFRSLFAALAAVHAQAILHRDIKPTNFLYEPARRRGVLVDFGLAERQAGPAALAAGPKPCLCEAERGERRRRAEASPALHLGPATGSPKNDTRPARRANRAGTRGFRAPEVLFKCTAQRPAIDVWAAGVILLTILSRRFPFFNSTDDVEATIEMATLFGARRMKAAALLHGALFETTIPTIAERGFALDKIILWSTCRAERPGAAARLSADEAEAVAFLERCLDLNPETRITAREALEHDFLREEEAEPQVESCTAEMEEDVDLLEDLCERPL